MSRSGVVVMLVVIGTVIGVGVVSSLVDPFAGNLIFALVIAAATIVALIVGCHPPE